MSKVTSIIVTILLLSILNLVMFIMYEEINKEEKTTPCYDRYSNEIVGATCIDKNIDMSMEVFWGLVIFSNFFLIFFQWGLYSKSGDVLK